MNGLKPYTGSEPYVFISYAHADEQQSVSLWRIR